MLGHRPSRQTGGRGHGPGPPRRTGHPGRDRRRSTQRARDRNPGPRPTGDQTRGQTVRGTAGHAPVTYCTGTHVRRTSPDTAGHAPTTYYTGAYVRGVEGIRAGQTGRTGRGTDRTAVHIRRRVEGIQPEGSGRAEHQRRIGALGPARIPRTTAGLTF